MSANRGVRGRVISRARGMTLVELMIVVVIVSIGVTAALSSFRAANKVAEIDDFANQIRDVLNQLGGRIDLQARAASDPEGQGTTFTVSIPARRVQDDLVHAAHAGAGESLQVLVVDDLSDVRDSLGDVTSMLGHACRAVGSAAEARPLLAAAHFDAVLIDLEMPDTDGLALATEIRDAGGPNSSSMLILISAAENQATGQAWPFDGFLQKPIDGQALARLIGYSTVDGAGNAAMAASTSSS